MRFLKIIIFFLILFHSSYAFPITCNIEGYIEFALEHNPQLRIEKTREHYAEGDYAIHEAEQRLRLNWKGELGYLNGKPPSPYSLVSGRTEDSIKVNGTDGSYYNTGISLNLPLYQNGTWLGKESPLISGAKYRVEESKYKYNVMEEDILYRVTGLYYSALKIMEDIKVQELRDKEYEREYKAREARLQLGLITQSELFDLESKWVAADHDLFRSRQALSLLKKELASVIGIDMNEEVIIEPPSDLIPDRPSLESLITISAENHPAIKSVRSFIKQIESELDLVRKAKQPVLDLNMSYSLGDDFGPPIHTYWTTSLNASVPLFDSGLTRAKEMSVQSKLNEAQLLLLQLSRETILNINRLYGNILEVEDRISYLEKDIVVARQSLTLTQERVKEHLSPESIVHEAELTLAEKEKLLVQARYDWRIAFSELRKEVGGMTAPARYKE
ncbi:MAG: TolC family protein [Nitrospirae bacterium]|nr:TolC family protein [Nitrospirota bacterium]